MRHVVYPRTSSEVQLEENTAQKVNHWYIWRNRKKHKTHTTATKHHTSAEQSDTKRSYQFHIQKLVALSTDPDNKPHGATECSGTSVWSVAFLRGTTLSQVSASQSPWQLRGRHFPAGGIFSSIVQVFSPSFTSSCKGGRHKKTPPPSETRNCTIWFIGLPMDYPIPLLNKFIESPT